MLSTMVWMNGYYLMVPDNITWQQTLIAFAIGIFVAPLIAFAAVGIFSLWETLFNFLGG